MFSSRSIAKDLLRRQNLHPSLADESIGQSSYDMIDPPVDERVEDTDLNTKSRHPFWTLRRRGPLVHKPETAPRGIEGRRVVSEPVISERRGGMSVLRRFKIGRGHQEMEEDEGDITISTETVSCHTTASA
jgi:hypothetical protein